MERIPAILRLDVEPDDFEPGPDRLAWDGFVTMAELVDQLRGPLADLSGTAIHPTWFLRLDPEIERCFGRADFVADRYRGIMDRLLSYGDPLGIHTHFYRWDEKKQVSYSDHADASWTTHCIDVAAKAFEQCFGEPARRSSQGGFFVSEAVVDRAIAVGIEVDVTAEPGLGPLTSGKTFGAYATAPSTDYQNFPRRPYYPSRAAVSQPAKSAADARPILIVPLTSYEYEDAEFSGLRRFAKKMLRRPSYHLPLSPWKAWTDPKTYWDLVARAADEGPSRYVALAIRTDAPTSETHLRVRALLEYLPKHAIAKRLRFVDPLSAEIRNLAKAD